LRSECEEVLRRFVKSASGEVFGCALVRANGEVECSFLPEGGLEPMAVIGASAIGLAKRVFQELGRGESVRAIFEGEHGRVILKDVGSDLMLVVFTSVESKLGMVFLEIERLSNILSELLK